MRWTLAATILCVSMTTGCAGRGGTIHPDVDLCPRRSAPILDPAGVATEEGKAWLGACLNAYRNNCRRLMAIRKEDPDRCDQGLY